MVPKNGTHFIGVWRFEKKAGPVDPVKPADSTPAKPEETLPNTGESNPSLFVALTLIVGGLGIYLLKNKKQYN